MSKNYYVFRVNYDEMYKRIRRDALGGILRQGWSPDGFDLRRKDIDTKIDKKWNKGNRFRNALKNMLNIKLGDIVIVPKLDINDKNDMWWRSFTIFEVINSYTFEPIEVDWGTDFGSIIGVKPLKSFCYTDSYHTEVIAGSFKSYRSPINIVYKENIKEFIEFLLDEKNTTSKISSEIDKIAKATFEYRKAYLLKLIDIIGNTSGTANYFEDLIKELFEKQGFVCIGRNMHNNIGGDVDILFNAINDNSFMSDVINLSDEYQYEQPEIWIQAKKKTGNDENDVVAINQLINQTENSDLNHININIVISLIERFNYETIKLAEKNNIVLINGLQFASLLIKYGIDVDKRG